MSIPVCRIGRVRLVLTDDPAASSYGRLVLAVQQVYGYVGVVYGPADPVAEAGDVPALTLVENWAGGIDVPGIVWYGRPENERKAALARFAGVMP